MKRFFTTIALLFVPLLFLAQGNVGEQPLSGPVLYEQAQSLLALGKLDSAMAMLQRAAQTPEVDKQWWFELGRLALYQEDSTAAAFAFQHYLIYAPADELAAQYLDWVTAGGPDSTPGTVRSMPFNSAQADFGGAPLGDGMVFSSERNNSQFGIKYQSSISKTPLANLYQVERRDSTQWRRNASVFDAGLNSKLHEGTVWIHPDTSYLLFARSTRLNKGSATEGIWISKRKDGQWQSPSPLPLNSADITVTHPWVDLKAGLLYFSSDHSSGNGGMDLYRVSLTTPSWDYAKNLGRSINGSGNEVYPTVTASGILHFASTSHAGMGGLDLFHAQPGPARTWKRKHWGPPVNSAQDDFAFYFDESTLQGWLTSNRGKGDRDDNVYQVQLEPTPPPLFSDCNPIIPFDFCYTFSDEITGESLPFGMRFRWDFGDGGSSSETVAPHCFAGPGNYVIKLQVTDSLTGDPIFNQASYELEVNHPYPLFIEGPDEAITGSFSVKAIVNGLQDLTINQYYWNTGEGHQLGDPEIIVDMGGQDSLLISLGVLATDFMGEPIKVCVERTFYAPGHLPLEPVVTPSASDDPQPTGDLPSTRYEIQVGTSLQPIPADAPMYSKIPGLTETFSEGVYRYWAPQDYSLQEALGAMDGFRDMGFQHPSVIRKGSIERDFKKHWLPGDQLDSIIVSGQVLDENESPVKGRIIWENLVTGEVMAETPLSAKGDYQENLSKNIQYGYYVDLEGYYSVSHHLDLTDYTGDVVVEKDWQLVSIADMIRYEIPVKINNLFFDFDQSSLRQESYRELERLTRFVNDHPNLKFHIVGHADNIGSDDYNLTLSLQRSGAVAKYLLLSGCNPNQILVGGVGEKQPVATNTTDGGRQENRRVEFKISRLVSEEPDLPKKDNP